MPGMKALMLAPCTQRNQQQQRKASAGSAAGARTCPRAPSGSSPAAGRRSGSAPRALSPAGREAAPCRRGCQPSALPLNPPAALPSQRFPGSLCWQLLAWNICGRMAWSLSPYMSSVGAVMVVWKILQGGRGMKERLLIGSELHAQALPCPGLQSRWRNAAALHGDHSQAPTPVTAWLTSRRQAGPTWCRWPTQRGSRPGRPPGCRGVQRPPSSAPHPAADRQAAPAAAMCEKGQLQHRQLERVCHACQHAAAASTSWLVGWRAARTPAGRRRRGCEARWGAP